MNTRDLLLTGFRLVVILHILYENDASKAEITEYLIKKHNIKISDETLKLDINTLIKAGFKIKRGTIKNNYRLQLEKDFVMASLTNDDLSLINAIKEASFDILDYKQILNLQTFYKRIASLVFDKKNKKIADFYFYNLINNRILKQLEEVLSLKAGCTIIYDSPVRGKIEVDIVPTKIMSRNNKLYLNCYAKKYKGVATFRLDNIKAVKNFFDTKSNGFKIRKKSNIKYSINKNCYNTIPLEKCEKVVEKNEDWIEIETDEKDEFFVIQRLLSLGKNCVRVKNINLKNKIIKNLHETLELYE